MYGLNVFCGFIFYEVLLKINLKDVHATLENAIFQNIIF